LKAFYDGIHGCTVAAARIGKKEENVGFFIHHRFIFLAILCMLDTFRMIGHRSPLAERF
jgi:hypothetical protein